jgi:hypothetical protein
MIAFDDDGSEYAFSFVTLVINDCASFHVIFVRSYNSTVISACGIEYRLSDRMFNVRNDTNTVP